MSSEQSSIRDLLETKVAVPPLARVLLAGVVIAGGLAFTVFGAFFLLHRPPTPYPHPFGVAILSLAILAFGIGFVWIGLRFVRKRADSENLLSPVARRRCSLIVGILATVMLVFAVVADSVQYLVAGVSVLVFSYWLFPSDRR